MQGQDQAAHSLALQVKWIWTQMLSLGYSYVTVTGSARGDYQE